MFFLCNAEFCAALSGAGGVNHESGYWVTAVSHGLFSTLAFIAVVCHPGASTVPLEGVTGEMRTEPPGRHLPDDSGSPSIFDEPKRLS